MPELALLDSAPQSPLHHAEGDVGIHTRMVLDELRSDPAWQALGREKRAELAWGCLLHDIGKPARTRVEDDGSITSRGHSGTGEVMARSILWEMGAPVAARESICRVAKWHQVPFFAGLRGDELDIKRLSLSMNLSELAICSRADARGRRTEPAKAWQETLDNIELFELHAREMGVWAAPMRCASHAERGIWLDKGGSIDPSYPWHAAAERPVLVACCGLPGSGKSTLASSLGLPVVGLDWARESLGAAHGEREGEARQLAMDALKRHLGSGSSVVFDATSLGSDQRERLAGMASDYGADCVFVHVEAQSPSEWRARNKKRGDKSLPERALMGMRAKWGAPAGFEGSAQAYFVSGRSDPEPVWGALLHDGWVEVKSQAAAAARSPRGKPTGPR